MRQFFRIALRVLILSAVFLASALTAMRFAIHGREVAVPKLMGLSSADADRSALASGLYTFVENRFYSSDVPEGRILSQLPPVGEVVRRGTRVRVAVSLGPQKLEIPNLVGQSQRAAEMNISRRGLELGTVAVAAIPGAPPDQVVAQSPPPNSSNVASPKVSLLVSAAPEPGVGLYLTPDFVGHTLEEASRAIAESPMRFGKVTTAKDTARAPNGGRTANGNAALSAATSVPSPAGPAAAPNSVAPAQAPPNGAPAATATNRPAAPRLFGRPVIAKSSPLIVKQSPAAGQKIPPGTQISFEVAR